MAAVACAAFGEHRCRRAVRGLAAIVRSRCTGSVPPVRTRTLLILAVCCGFAILVAGGLQLLRIANEESAGDEYHALGQAVEVGDLTIVVESFSEASGVATVAVRLGGVDDRDGSAAFRLVVPGEVLVPNRGGDDACGATTVAEQSCELTFGVADVAGGAWILKYQRGDESAVWELTA